MTIGERIERDEQHMYTVIGPNYEQVVEKLQKRIEDLESKFNENGAFVGAGVACPEDGVGTRGVNISTEEGTYLPGKTKTYTLLDSHTGQKHTLQFAGGVLVAPEAEFRVLTELEEGEPGVDPTELRAVPSYSM